MCPSEAEITDWAKIFIYYESYYYFISVCAAFITHQQGREAPAREHSAIPAPRHLKYRMSADRLEMDEFASY